MRVLSSFYPALVVCAVALVGAAVVISAPEYLLTRSPKARELNPAYQGLRLIRDDFDRGNFAGRGAFLREHSRPYVDVYSEYPQLATYLFAFPYLFVSSNEAHMVIFTFLMAAALGATAFALTSLCARVGVSNTRVFLLLLPGTLYFSLNRFDAVPTALVMTALAVLLAGRVALGHAVLAAAFLTKAYPLLYVPLFGRVAWDRGGWRAVARGWAAFVGTIAACTAQIAAWIGLKPLLGPYLFFGNRLDNSQSVYHFLSLALPNAAQVPLRAACRAAQAGFGLGPLAAGRLSARDVMRWLTLMTAAFIVFTRFQSPQWVIWITAPGLVAARDRTELGLLITQDLMSYLYFPLAYDRFGAAAPALAFVIGLLTATRLILIGCLLRPDARPAAS
jgi:hypothetical protein